MSLTITALSSLVTIGKNIIDTIKSAKDLFKNDDKQQAANAEAHLDTLTKSFEVYQERVELLAEQIYQCETLSRFLPQWLLVQDKFNYISVTPTPDELILIDSELRRFIADSIHDHFSSAFFRTNYDKLPEIEAMITNFRNRIKDLDRDLNAIPPGHAQMLGLSWGTTLKADLFRLRRDVLEIENKANEKFEAVVNELREVASLRS
jgi:polyhydroxyalkanoate synthesis regulator phasin